MKNNQQGQSDFNDDELKSIAPTLAGLKRELQGSAAGNPFATPEGYFDEMNSEVMNKIQSIPGVESVSNENPFAVPAGYFENLPSEIQQKIIERETRKNAIAQWIGDVVMRPVPKFTLALASIVLVIVFSAKYFTRTVKVDYVQQQPESEQLDAVYLQQLDESTLAEVFTEETTSVTGSQDAGIENYLLDNDVDLNSITEQL